MNGLPIAYAASYEEARLLWSALRSSGIVAQVRPVATGRYTFALVVPGEVFGVAADLAHQFAERLKLDLSRAA